MITLKPRLAALAGWVPVDAKVIDVGTDHAYLPVYLIQQGIARQAVGTEIHRGPFDSAVEQVATQGLEDKITVYLGDGLQPVTPGAGDVVVIAGMGGTTIIDILAHGANVLRKIKRLILQPMVAGLELRTWLIKNGWAIIAEQLVEEDSRIYEVIVAEPGVQELPDRVLLELGPFIVANRDPLLPNVVKHKVDALSKVLRQLGHAKTTEAVEARREALKWEIEQLRGVLE